MSQLPDMVQQILERLVDFFDIFDLSFFVSGAMVLAGSLYLLQLVSAEWAGFPVPDWGSSFIFGAVILSCYLMGMMAFAMGRWLRGLWSARKNRKAKVGQVPTTANMVWTAAEEHDLLSFDIYRAYKVGKEAVEGDASEDAKARLESLGGSFYTRLWAELRQTTSLKPSYILIRRYWVMSATYDGVAVALIFWILLAGLTAIPMFEVVNGLFFLGLWGLLVMAFSGLSYACFREANRYQRYQIAEIVATLAYLHQMAAKADSKDDGAS